MDNPLAELNPSDLLPRVKENYPGYQDAEYNTLDGLFRRKPPSPKASYSGSSTDVEALDDERHLEHAAKAAQCTTCHVLVTVTWARVTSDILAGDTVTSQTVASYLEDACDKDALDAMLKKYTILKMEGDGGNAAVLFFVVRERRKQPGAGAGAAAVSAGGEGKGAQSGAGLGEALRGDSGVAAATDAEEAAVTLSCKNLVRDSGRDLTDVIMDQLVNYRREAVRLLQKHNRDDGNEQQPPPPPRKEQLDKDAAAAAAAAAAKGSGSAAGGAGSSGRLPRLDGGGAANSADDDDDYVDPDDLDDEGEVIKGKGEGKGASGGKAAAAGGKAVATGGNSGGGGAKGGSPAGGVPTGMMVLGLKVKLLPGEVPCEDLHHKCAEWAAGGECEINPAYMIGTYTHLGHCRKSCGLCQPGEALKSAPQLSADLESLSSALLLAVKNLGCGASGACLTGVGGMAATAGLLRIKQQQQAGAGGKGVLGGVGGKKELPPGMKEFPGGFILGKPWWAVPDVEMVPPALRKPVPGEAKEGAPASAAADPSGGTAGAGGADGGAAAQLAPPSHAEVDALLAPALAHRLLSIPSDFFTYEFLYKNHTRQFHKTTGASVTEDWLLGRFSRESVSLMSSATGEVAGLEELDLLPGSPLADRLQGYTWPYVKQVYAGGDECVLAGGRRVVRRVEARLACSPDANTYMLIREPDFCTYVYVIYVPQLCKLEYYKPRSKEGAAGASGSKAETAAGGKRRVVNRGAGKR